jgi:type IV secretion system protein VirB4
MAYAATNGATPYRLNLHVGDVGHTLVFGPTGAGKSTLLCFLVAQFRRYRNAHVVCFDKGRSMLPLALAAGGRHYDLASEGDSTGLCPLQHLESDADASWAEEWIATCYELQAKAKPSPQQKEQIHRAIRSMRKSSLGRSLTDFVTTVQDEAVRSALTPYTLSGNMGRLMDEVHDGLKDDPFSVFELDELMQLGDTNVIPVLLYLFRRIEKALKGQPALLVLDEAWLMLGHPVFAAKVREWLKTLRRANCAVILATQSLSDAARSSIFDVLIESCPTKILLPNEEANKRGTPEQPGPWEMYTALGLNATEIQLVMTSVKKRHYYVTSPEGRRLIDLALGPIALSFLAVNDRENLARVRQLVEAFGEAWPFAWLEQRKVSYERFIEPGRVRNVRAA